MQYSVNITHCASIIANIYGSDYPYITKEKDTIWIDVETAFEADYISRIEYYQCETFSWVRNLEKYLDIKSHD